MCETCSIGAHVTNMQGNMDESGSAHVTPTQIICYYDGHPRTYQTLEGGFPPLTKTTVDILPKQLFKQCHCDGIRSAKIENTHTGT